ncbi:MAG: outer membrane protein assembly factor BamE [Alphaproteobacteria bacterium]|nr:outer membrane protein assembly factor BamE [Alphaproteobacteria bacterium]
MKKKVIGILLSGMLLSACGLESYPAGDLPTQARLNAIAVGDSKEKVVRVLGTPALENTPMPDGTSFIIYAQNLKESRAFLEPKEVKRDVYVYFFNNKDILTEQKHLTLADKQSVSYDASQTDVGGRELSVLDQIVQNFGRYNTGSQDSSVRR